MAIFVVFCTTYSLILNAITLEVSPDPDPDSFMINGVETDGTYTWEDLSAGISAEVTLHGNAGYVGTLPKKPDWQLSLSFEDTSSLAWLEEQIEGDMSLPLMAFHMQLTADDGDGNKAEVLLGTCKADVTLRLRLENVKTAAQPLAANLSSGSQSTMTTVPVSAQEQLSGISLAISVLSENGELTGADLPEAGEWVTLTYSVRANETVMSLASANIDYLLQHYLNVAGFDITDNPGSAAALPIRNMSTAEPMVGFDSVDRNGKIEWINQTQNQLKNSGKLFYILLNNEGRPQTKRYLSRMLQNEYTNYRLNPQLRYMNRLYNGEDDQNTNYKLIAIWVSKEGVDQDKAKDSDDATDFDVIDVSNIDNPDLIRFTNNPSNSHIGQGATDTYPYEKTILIRADAVVRLVFDYTTSAEADEVIETPVNFFDYNIGDGYIYSTNNSATATRTPTGQQTFDRNWYMYTPNQGVNSSAAYSTARNNKGSLKFVFGNSNTGNDTPALQTWKGDTFNIYNRNNFQGAIFNLVETLEYEDGWPRPHFNDEILVPDLFSKNEQYSNEAAGIKWKHVYGTTTTEDADGNTVETSPYVLGFRRSGGTYTLDYVKGQEVVVVDGNLKDTGWNANGWVTVNRNNGAFQGGIDSMVNTASKNFTYKFQMRTDDTKLYVAAVYDNVQLLEGTKFRLWLNTNPEATVYTHFYDVYIQNNKVIAEGKRNQSTTANSATLIGNSSVVGAIKAVDGKVQFEMSVDLAEFGGENGFRYFTNAAPKIGADNVQLLFPAVATGDNNRNFPYNTWDAAKAGSANVAAMKFGMTAVTSDLSQFVRMDYGTRDIYTNEFWPMDGSPSHGTDGNDMLFGSKVYSSSLGDILSRRRWTNLAGTSYSLPPADMSGANSITGGGQTISTVGDYDHNAYFAMSFSRTFTVEPGYRAPMNYWFYGDDDLWVFLEELDADGNPISSQKIADLGGVHSAVGEYVNLWDYIEPIDYEEEAKTYRLTVFYIERGASGSCCYMRIVVPLESRITPEPNRNEALVFEKLELDADGNPVPYDPNGRAYHFELRLFNEFGVDFEDAYDYSIYRSYDAEGKRVNHTDYDYDSGAPPELKIDEGVLEGESGVYTFTLHSGEYIVLRNLPGDDESDGIIGIDTFYSIRELRTANDDFVTQYSLGTHTHANEGGKEIQVDTIYSTARYDYGAGLENRIHLRTYNYVLFTNSPLLKTELFPGNGNAVHVDDEITYEIEWANDTHSISDIIVTDPLDEGVTFVGASVLSAADADASGRWWEYDGKNMVYTDTVDNFTITYDPDTHTVVWNMKSRAAETFGIVSLKVRVNKKALKEETTEGAFGTTTARVENYAIVQIDNRVLTTNKVENPVWQPVKDEPTPGAGAAVSSGDELFYTVTWKNYMNQPATVLVRDPLDDRVSYLLDTAKVYYGTYGSDDVTELTNAVISYDAETHTLHWDLGVQPAGAQGYVCFSVKVNETNAVGGLVWNWGFVQVGDDRELETNHISNPIYGYLLPTTGGIGKEVYQTVGVALIFLASALLLRGKFYKVKKRKNIQ